MLRKVHISELTRRQRETESSFEHLPKWPEMRAALEGGLAPQEGLELVVTDEQAAKYDLTHRRTGSRFLKKFVQGLGKRYTVKSIRREDATYYQVMNDLPVTKRKTGAA